MRPVNTKRVSRHIRALRIARECAALGARSRTIEYVTGVSGTEVRNMLFPERAPPGRAPASPDWYHSSTLLSRVEASMFASVYQRIRKLGFAPAEALLAAYKHYLHVCSARPRVSFDRAFDLASHLDGVWLSSASSLMLATCPSCSSEYATSAGAVPRSNRECPFCKLVKRYPRDAKLRASWPRKVIALGRNEVMPTYSVERSSGALKGHAAPVGRVRDDNKRG